MLHVGITLDENFHVGVDRVFDENRSILEATADVVILVAMRMYLIVTKS